MRNVSSAWGVRVGQGSGIVDSLRWLMTRSGTLDLSRLLCHLPSLVHLQVGGKMDATLGLVSRHKNNQRRMHFFSISVGSKERISRALNRLSPYMPSARRCQFLNPSLAKGMGLCGPNRSNSRDGSSSWEMHRCVGRNGNLANSRFT